jgi:hypothetical protein
LAEQGITEGIAASDAAHQLNTTRVQHYRVLQDHDLLTWAAMNANSFAMLQSAAASNTVAEVGLRLINDPGRTLSLNNPQIQSLIAGLVASGALDQSGADALYAMAAETVSIPEAEGFGKITVRDVERARAQV